MSQQQSAEEIERRMRDIRSHLGSEVEDLVGQARQLMNWRHYVRAYPWGSVAAAAAIGYFAVPRRLEITSPDPKTLEKLARDHRLVVEHKPPAYQKPGIAVSLANLMGNMLLRAGLAYVGQQSGKFFGTAAAEQLKAENKKAEREYVS